MKPNTQKMGLKQIQMDKEIIWNWKTLGEKNFRMLKEDGN